MTDENESEEFVKCGRCHGTGRIEIHEGCQVEPWASLYREEKNEPDEFGFKRVKCADCKGLGYL